MLGLDLMLYFFFAGNSNVNKNEMGVRHRLDSWSCREEIAGALQEFCNRWCKREHVESNAFNSWKLNIFKIIDGRISFYCNNLDLLPPKPKYTFRHLRKGIQEFHRKFVLAPADKAANNVVVV